MQKEFRLRGSEKVGYARAGATLQYARCCETSYMWDLPSQFVKRPGTNKRVARPRPPREWRIIEHPELRIVSTELWRRVQERQELIKSVYGRAGAGLNKASSSQYLLTGFLEVWS